METIEFSSSPFSRSTDKGINLHCGCHTVQAGPRLHPLQSQAVLLAGAQLSGRGRASGGRPPLGGNPAGYHGQ